MVAFRPRRILEPERPRHSPRALAWYGAGAVLTLLSAVAVHGALSRAASAEAAYGTTAPVVVATAAIRAGEPLTGRVTIRRWPRALVPDAALDRLPGDRVARADIGPGEALVTRDVGRGSGAVSGLLDPGERAVAVPIAVPGLGLRVGDEVDVVTGGPAVDDPSASPLGGPEVVVSGGRVVDVGDEAVVIATRASGAATLAAALAQGPVHLALRPPGG